MELKAESKNYNSESEKAIRKAIRSEAEALAGLLTERGLFVTTAESLTGGMISASLVDIPGSSNWFSDGFVTYSNEAKIKRLGVDAETLSRETAVSAPVARMMAAGALKMSGADFAVAVTGLAGPGADEFGRNPGLVYIGIACRGGTASKEYMFSGTRLEIRRKTNLEALILLKTMVQNLS